MKKIRVYGLIGKNLSHSFSKQYFEKKFQNESITDSEYINIPLKTIDELPGILDNIPLLKGVNVTIPYKKQVIPYLDSLDEVSGRIGAVNTIKISRSGKTKQLAGYNTDVYGFKESLIPFLRAKEDKAIVLGSGGASEAVKFVLLELGIETVVVSRNPGKEDAISYDDLDEEFTRNHRIIINTKTVGMFPEIEDCPDLDFSILTRDHLLFDLVYNPETTLFLKKGKEAGSTIVNGRRMLELQAEKSWEIWNT